jgi:uncharacterized protein YneF (UPF0154 family)
MTLLIIIGIVMIILLVVVFRKKDKTSAITNSPPMTEDQIHLVNEMNSIDYGQKFPGTIKMLAADADGIISSRQINNIIPDKEMDGKDIAQDIVDRVQPEPKLESPIIESTISETKISMPTKEEYEELTEMEKKFIKDYYIEMREPLPIYMR